MMLYQFLATVLGAVLIRFLHVVRRRVSGSDRYFSFSDFLIEERTIQSRGVLGMALPPLVGGVALAALPGVAPVSAAAAGFLAAFLGVWPVYAFPYQLLDRHLIRYWGKLKYLYALFVGFSTAMCYVGFVAARAAVPVMKYATGTRAWDQFMDTLGANALYDAFKWGVIALLTAGGVYVSRERKRLGDQVSREEHERSHGNLR